MSNSQSPNDVAKIISNIIVEQIKSQQTNSSDFQVLLKEHKTDEIILKSIIPIYKVLQVLHSENKIDTEEYNERINSLVDILQLLEDVNELGE